MPCSCWYNPHPEDQKEFKRKCSELVDFIKSLERIGDPGGCTLKDAQKLLEHLYTGKCDEKPKEEI